MTKYVPFYYPIAGSVSGAPNVPILDDNGALIVRSGSMRAIPSQEPAPKLKKSSVDHELNHAMRSPSWLDLYMPWEIEPTSKEQIETRKNIMSLEYELGFCRVVPNSNYVKMLNLPLKKQRNDLGLHLLSRILLFLFLLWVITNSVLYLTH